MASISAEIIAFLANQLQSGAGINAALAASRKTDSRTPQEIRLFTVRNIAAELMEKSNQALYPTVLVYCEKLSNTLAEKFRTFSGEARLTVELRNSEDRLEALDSTLIYTDLVCNLLDDLRGEWITGVSYNGGYEVTYSPIRAGGKHFLQAAKVTFAVDISE